MAKPRRNPTLFPEMEVCTKCGAEMKLARSEPSHPEGCNLHTFECSECNNVDQFQASRRRGLGRGPVASGEVATKNKPCSPSEERRTTESVESVSSQLLGCYR